MQLERVLGGVALDRALGRTDPKHATHNLCLLGADALASGPAIAGGEVEPAACVRLHEYYERNHSDSGMRIGGVVRGGFGRRYENTHEAADHAKQKRLTVVQENRDGTAYRQWCHEVGGFEGVEQGSRALAERAFPQYAAGLTTTAWHIIEQPFGAGDSTSFGAHTDDLDEPAAVVTVVVKLTEGWSRMAMEGAMCSFVYGPQRGTASAFDSRCWHRSIPIRECDPTALKIAFFYKARRPPR
jgi:hypothetical protein